MQSRMMGLTSGSWMALHVVRVSVCVRVCVCCCHVCMRVLLVQRISRKNDSAATDDGADVWDLGDTCVCVCVCDSLQFQ